MNGAALGALLTRQLEISTPPRDLIAEVERRAGNDELTHVLRTGDREALDAWLWGKDNLDLLALSPQGAFSAAEFVGYSSPCSTILFPPARRRRKAGCT